MGIVVGIGGLGRGVCGSRLIAIVSNTGGFISSGGSTIIGSGLIAIVSNTGGFISSGGSTIIGSRLIAIVSNTGGFISSGGSTIIGSGLIAIVSNTGGFIGSGGSGLIAIVSNTGGFIGSGLFRSGRDLFELFRAAVDQLLQHGGCAARKRGEHARGAGEGGLEHPGHDGEQPISRRDVGELRDALRGEELATQKAALDGEDSMIFGEVAQHLGHRGGIALGIGHAGRTNEESIELLELQLIGGSPRQGHLHDLELGIVGAQLASQRLLFFDREPGVLGEEHGL